MSIEGQGNFFTIDFPGFVCFVLYQAKISGEPLQDQWSSGFLIFSLKHRLLVLVRTASFQNQCFEQKREKNITIFHLKIIAFTAEENCSILHWRVFVMQNIWSEYPRNGT